MHKLLTVLVNAILRIFWIFALKSLLNSDAVAFEFSELSFDLARRHFRCILVHFYFFLIENREVILFPDLSDYVESCIHFAISSGDFLQVLDCIQSEPPGASFNPCSIKIVSNCQSDFEDIMKSVVSLQGLKSSRQAFNFILKIIVHFFLYVCKVQSFDSISILRNWSELFDELLRFA